MGTRLKRKIKKTRGPKRGGNRDLLVGERRRKAGGNRGLGAKLSAILAQVLKKKGKGRGSEKKARRETMHGADQGC